LSGVMAAPSMAYWIVLTSAHTLRLHCFLIA